MARGLTIAASNDHPHAVEIAWLARGLKQPGGKLVFAWATESDWDPSSLVSNTFTMEWPKNSGQIGEFPEVDRAEWFEIAEAARRIRPGQQGFLYELYEKLTGKHLEEFTS